MSKNPFWGVKCCQCTQVYHDEYFKDPLYVYSSCHETLMGRKMWTCGECGKKASDEMKAMRCQKKGICKST